MPWLSASVRISAIALSTSPATPARSRFSVFTCTLKMRYRATWLTSTAPVLGCKCTRLLSRTSLWSAVRAGNVQQVFQLAMRIFGILHGDEVLIARLVVDPEIAIDRDAGIDRGDDLHHHVVRVEADQIGRGAIDFDHHIRSVEPLHDMGIGRAADLGDSIANCFGQRIGFRLATPFDLDLHRRIGAVVQRRGNHAAGVETDFQRLLSCPRRSCIGSADRRPSCAAA